MNVRIIREMPEGEFTEHVNAVNSYESLVERGAFSLVNRNYLNMKMMLDAFSNVEKYGGEFREANRQVVKRSFMAELTNWLAATRLYLENERDFILREFGQSSDEMRQYRAATSTAFDQHEGYRFLYNLRDYTQHCGIPPGHFNVSGLRPHRKVEITLDKSRLLTARFKWGSHAKTLLHGWPERIRLMPLLEDAMKGYVAVEEQMLRINLGRCARVAPMLLGALRAGDLSEGNAALFQISRRAPGSESIEILLRAMPTVSALEAVKSASSSTDPLDTIRAAEMTPPPPMPTDGTRASAVLSSFLSGGGAQGAADMVNRILQRDGEAGPLISDLINTSTVLTHMLSQIMGAPPYALLGKLESPDDA